MAQKKLVRKAEPPSKRGMAWPRWTGFRNKTVWDFLQLLIVPLMLVAIGFWFTAQQDARQQKIEKKRAEAEQELAVQRAQDEALQAYLSQMSQLMLEKDLRHADAEDEVLTVARARTLTVLERLDPSRKTAVMQFITEAGLVQGSLNEKATGRKDPFEGVPIISLSGADLSGTDLSELGVGDPGFGKVVFIHTSPRGKYYFGGGGSTFLDGADLSSADLSGADLHGAYMTGANLEEADLSNANLSNADLSNTDLSGANLDSADLSGANLDSADLSYADLSNAKLSNAKLSNVHLSNADLSNAKLSNAKLSNVHLDYADLSGAEGLTNEELEQAYVLEGATEQEQAYVLEGATMPDGQTLRGVETPNGPTFEEWLKDKRAREENE